MTDEYPPPNPRPRLEISMDDLDAPTAPRAPAHEPPAPAAWPPPPAKPVKEDATAVAPMGWPSPAAPTAWPPPPGDAYPPAPGVPAAQGYASHNANANTMAVAAMAMNHKSPGVAVLLSLLWTGAGQIYCGRAGRGIAFFFAALFSFFLVFVAIGFVLLPIVWIWAAIDAGNLAKQQNALLMAAIANQNGY